MGMQRHDMLVRYQIGRNRLEARLRGFQKVNRGQVPQLIAQILYTQVIYLLKCVFINVLSYLTHHLDIKNSIFGLKYQINMDQLLLLN